LSWSAARVQLGLVTPLALVSQIFMPLGNSGF